MAQPRARPPNPDESRQKSRKVKTGCRTCKIRKVKCDEARPSCHRCLSTGRVCDGYGIWGGGGGGGSRGGRSSQPFSSSDRPAASSPSQKEPDAAMMKPMDATTLRVIPLHVVSADEHLGMEWFLQRTLGKLPGMFQSAFWNTLLPQVSLSEPAVRHAVLTLGSVHKRQALHVGTSLPSLSPPALVTADKTESEFFTLQQYIRATSDLRQRMEHNGGQSTKVALIACAIFVHLECIRGCHQTALTHLRHGLILLEEILDINANTNGKTGESGASHDVVDEWMMHVFTSLFVQARLFGQDIAQPRLLSRATHHIKPVAVGKTFQSPHHARHSLEHIFLRIFGVMSQAQRQQQQREAFESAQGARSSPSPSSCELDDACARLQIELDTWLQTYEIAPGSPGLRMTDNQTSYSSAIDKFAWRLLRVYHTLACVMLVECLPSATPSAVAAASAPSPDKSPWSQSFANSSLFTSESSHSASSTSSTYTSSAFSMTSPSTGSPPSQADSTNNLSLNSQSPTTLFFQSILSQCQILFKLAFGPSIQSFRPHRPPADQDNSNTIADIGWIPPLYYTALHCHEPAIRNEATRMLRFVPHREGFWDSWLAATVAEKILSLEEATRRSCGYSCAADNQAVSTASTGEGANVHDIPMVFMSGPCTGTVVKDVHVALPEGSDGTLVLDYNLHSHHDGFWLNGRSSYHLSSSHWNDECGP